MGSAFTLTMLVHDGDGVTVTASNSGPRLISAVVLVDGCWLLVLAFSVSSAKMGRCPPDALLAACVWLTALTLLPPRLAPLPPWWPASLP